jgi:hypothetical protein
MAACPGCTTAVVDPEGAGETEKSARTPVPESETAEGVFVPLSETVSTPWLALGAVGVKTTPIVQLAPTASDEPQLLVCVKAPPALIEVIVKADWPELVSVTF